MSTPLESPAIIVARFLRSNNYHDTLDAFLLEAGLPADSGTTSKGALTIERILEEKRTFDLSLGLEKVGIDEDNRGWSLPAPSVPIQVSTLPSATNLLHVSIERFEETAQGPRQSIVATTADRQLHLIAPDRAFSVIKSMAHLHDSPILACIPYGKQTSITITSGMSGQTVLYDHEKNKVLDERRDHTKYVVKASTYEEDGGVVWTATAGWDAKVFLYRTVDGSRLGEPLGSVTLATVPETLAFVKHPDSGRPILLITRRDSTFLHYYLLPDVDVPGGPITEVDELTLLGSQNLAPHSNAWIAFSPSSIAVCPTDPTLLAVATSALPHLKVIIVRLLIPPIDPSRTAAPGPATQSAQTRANLAIQDREDAALLVHVSTLAPQTSYSTPQVVWRPDGSGVWVNGDDGVLRGVEAKTGKIISTLKEGHEPGSKIRSIWCGLVDVDGKKVEWIVSGGFDHRLVVWKPKEAV